jgi:hypothetical protein
MNSWYPLVRRKFELWCVYTWRVADHNRRLCRQLFIIRGACQICQTAAIVVGSFTYSHTHKCDDFGHMQQLDAGEPRGVDGQAGEP